MQILIVCSEANILQIWITLNKKTKEEIIIDH